MKKIMFLMFLVLSCGHLFSQTYYIILTSQQLKGRKVTEDGGIYKIQLSKPSEVQKSPSIFFSVESPDRKIYESFRYADHDVEKLQALRARSSSDPKWAIVRSEELTDTLIKPVSFLKTIHPIDLDKEFPVMTLESAKKLFEPLRGKKVYIIDRNDITDTTVKLIGVRYVTPRSQVPVYVDGEYVIQ